MLKIQLRNGVEMPAIMMGTSTADKKGSQKKLIRDMADVVFDAIKNGVCGFDTSRDYANEAILGNVVNKLIKSKVMKREDLFVTTKVGNRQQRNKDMVKQIDLSLRNFGLDYIDLWLLHWPLPGYYIDNWQQMCDIYKSGKVRAIGIANCRTRHIVELEKANISILPHVTQIEFHPFRTVPKMREVCMERKIQIEAYSANCLMLPFVRDNEVLKQIAKSHNKSIAQVIMRWHVQQGVVPIFSSTNPEHIAENIGVFDFSLSEKEMETIFDLDMDYKFHPESLNCPGY